jgi:hypothetical protein
MASRKKSQSPDKELTPLQQSFINHLSQDPRQDLAKAARAAGYAADSAGWDLMHLPQYAHVQAAYKVLADERFAKFANCTDEDVFRLFTVWAFGDRRKIRRVMCGELTVDDLWPEEEWLIDSYRAISRNDGSGDFVYAPEMVSRREAAVILAKMKGMLRERVQLDASIEFEAAQKSLDGKLDMLAAELAREALEEPESDGKESP